MNIVLSRKDTTTDSRQKSVGTGSVLQSDNVLLPKYSYSNENLFSTTGCGERASRQLSEGIGYLGRLPEAGTRTSCQKRHSTSFYP